MASPAGQGSDPRKRTSGAGPRRRTRAGVPVSRPGSGPRRGAGRPKAATPQPAAERPRFTGRAAVLVLVLALLLVSYASSLRAYLDQQHHLAGLRASIATSQAQVDRLTAEKRRWKDPDYVKEVAHERFGWVMPGEVGFRVLDEKGRPLDATDSLSAPGSVAQRSRPLWWRSAWGSVVAAGKPVVNPEDVPTPATRITPRTSTDDGSGG